MSVPKFDDLFNPLLTASQQLGSSASIAELEQTVAQSNLLKTTWRNLMMRVGQSFLTTLLGPELT
jgi:hypothetical protein